MRLENRWSLEQLGGFFDEKTKVDQLDDDDLKQETRVGVWRERNLPNLPFRGPSLLVRCNVI